MHCLPKSIVQIMTRGKGDSEALIQKEVTPDFRILLVGGRGAGKSTFLKQANQKYGKGFSESNRLMYKKFIINNLYKSANDLFDALRASKLEIALDKMVVEEIKKQYDAWAEHVPVQHLELIKRIWKDPKVKNLHSTQCLGGDYYLNQVSRIANAHYTPTIHEMMSLEPPTTVVRSQVVRLNGINFEVTDTPGCEEGDMPGFIGKNYDFVIYFMSLSEFRTAKTATELQEISENISNLKKVAELIGDKTTILLYFTQTHEYIMTQKYAHKGQSSDYFSLSKSKVMKYFAKIIDSLPNNVYNYFEETSKLNNMKLVYELIKHEEIMKNLRNINLSP